ncbi:MAG: hypothetical protein AB7I18_01695 [Candidatus Berkiella sp.]
MIAGTRAKAENEEDQLKKLPQELRVMIFSYFPYGLQLKLRSIAIYWKQGIEIAARHPLLNTEVLKKALSYTSTKTTNPREIGLPQLEQNYASLSLCPVSLDSLIMRFKSKAAYETASGQWECKEIEPPIKISVLKIFSYAFQKAGLDQQYISLQTREQRHAFISNYMQFPNTQGYPRFQFLKNQSKESLERLKASLARYQDPCYQELSLEVDKAVGERVLPNGTSWQVR